MKKMKKMKSKYKTKTGEMKKKNMMRKQTEKIR